MLGYVEGSKIENLKSLDESAKRPGTGGEGDSLNTELKKAMRKNSFVSAAASIFLLACILPANIARSSDVPTIGFLSARARLAQGEKAFRQGLREIGLIDGQNISVEWRFAKGRIELLSQFAEELVRMNVHRKQIVELAVNNRLPAIYDDKQIVEAGGLMSYGTNVPDLYRRAARFVARILNGASPGSLQSSSDKV